MYEDRPEKDTPPEILEELRDYGGETPDGKALWRLVLARNCRIHCFGRLNHISQDLEKLPDNARPTDVVPDRIEEGEFWIPRFDFDGWILQRWFPGSVWGTREQWESERAQDGRTKLLAAYPQHGDYMIMPCGPWKSIAELGDLKGAMRCYNAQQKRNPANWENYMQAQLAFEQQARQRKADAYAEEISAQHRESLSGVLRTVSSSAQEFRNVVSKHTAQGVNLGASEKWG